MEENHLSKRIKQMFSSRAKNGISSVHQAKIIDGLQKINYSMNKVLILLMGMYAQVRMHQLG